MKIDRSKLKKCTSEVPPECAALIERLRSCRISDLANELVKIDSWSFGKCELYHWIDVLDIFDGILAEAARRTSNSCWVLSCDYLGYPDHYFRKRLLLLVLHFTTLLIEHSFSRHLYNSMEHLIWLLSSNDMHVVLGVLNLLYMFSKRSNFIPRLNTDKRHALINRLIHLAESWGGKENGFGLAECCKNVPISSFPPGATTLHFEFYANGSEPPAKAKIGGGNVVVTIHLDDVDKMKTPLGDIMQLLVSTYDVPADKQMLLLTHLRLAHCFSNYELRLLCVQARLQALSVLVYSNAITDFAHFLLYRGLLEELVEVLELQSPNIVEIRAAALRTLTSIIHLERNPHIPNLTSGRRLNMIIRVTGAASYHGFLPVMVRTCITSLTTTPSVPPAFPLPLATALFSFLYHMASYEAGGEALVSCGMMESLLKVIRWPGSELEHITFVTRAVRVIDLITNIDMQAFQMHGGLLGFINRLELEVNVCRKEQPFVIKPSTETEREDRIDPDVVERSPSPQEAVMDIEIEANTSNDDSESTPRPAKPCLPQRAALLKSMLNFLKKAIQDPAFADSIRHVMDGSLPSSLKHIISNAEYYGPSLFLLATDVVTVYVFQEPSLLSSLQDNGLTDVVLHALLVKEVPATREVLGSLPNVFSALCLNARGLSAFVRCCPFERLFKVLLSPVYLAAMRRRRSSDPMGDTASNLGNAMDELMRHQPSLKTDATYAIIKLLEELCNLGRDPKYVCWRPQNKADMPIGIVRLTGGSGSSDDEEEEEDDETTQSRSEETDEQPVPVSLERIPIPLVDYILNVMKFVDAILSNNSTDDHCREFVNQRGLQPLISILGLPNLPVDCPVTTSAQAVASVCKSILNLAHEPQVLEEGQRQAEKVLQDIYVLINPDSYNELIVTSQLLKELSDCPNPDEALNMDSQTPLLHMVAACQSYTVMLIHVCRTGQSDIRAINICRWGTPFGLRVLDQFMKVYEYIMWESNCLLAFSGDDVIDPRNDFGLKDIEKLRLPDEKSVMQTKSKTWKVAQAADNGMTSAMEALSTDPPVKMDVDPVENLDLIKPECVVRPMPTPNQLKYISPLLATASRLGRTMAELFALLVKLCVGSPLRQRRGQIGPISATAVHYAQEVASRLSTVLKASLSYTKFSHSPTALLQLTYLNSTMGYVTPLLFDDKKFPYHLMLNEFIKSECHQVFFESFRWVLNGGDLENPSLPCGVVTLEFVENWLELMEKLVNPKYLLDSPHAMPPSKTGSTVPASFDPIKYLIVMQKLAFDSLMLLWNQDPKVHNRLGARITSVCLLIWRHILRAEVVIEERIGKNKEISGAAPGDTSTAALNTTSTANDLNSSTVTSIPTATVPPTPAAAAAAAAQRNNEELDPEISEEFLNRLVDMGFNREMSIQALRISPTVEQATEYLLNAPFLNTMEMEVSEEDQVHQAIAMSLGESTKFDDATKKTEATSNDAATVVKAKPEEAEALKKEEIDKFTGDAPATCLFLLDILGSTAVFQVCDLLVIIVKRNGNEFRDKMLRMVLKEVTENVNALLEQVTEAKDNTQIVEVLMNSEAAKKTEVRLHVFSLLFEEMKAPSAVAVQELKVIDKLVHLLSKAEPSLTQTQTPKWLAPMLLLLDLFEKVSISTKRKNAMHKICSLQWKWYDLGTGKWCPYNASHNKLINQSYWGGESSIRINYGRRKYTLQFSCMYQSNDETGNRRPIMMGLIDKKPAAAATQKPGDKTAAAAETIKDKNEEMEVEETKDADEDEDVVVNGIGDQNASSLIKSCVYMLGIPIENDALHAMMRICLRITRKYEHAMQFAELGGIKIVLNLTYASHFAGFVSLSTLLIRHVMEEPLVLRQAMEKVLKAKTQPNIPPPYKELFYMLRMCGNAICRDPDIFLKLAKETLKVDVGILSRRNEEDDTRLLLKMSPASQNAHNPSEEQVSTRVISDLLDALVVPPVDNGESKASEQEASTSSASNILPSASPPTPRVTSLPPLHAALARQGLLRNSSSGELNAADTDEQPSKADSGKASPKKSLSEDMTRPLVPRSSILKILAEAVRSYSHVCKLIINYSYPPNASEYVTEGCTALSFILDNLLRDCPRCRDVECANMARMLIAALASCNHSAETQTALVVEVKGSLLRVLAMPESATKHIQIQQLCNLVSVMIDNCPTPSSSQGSSANKSNNCGTVNNIVRLMQRKGLIMDLARIPHSLDLSSPNMHVTVNSALKPLETLSRLVNHPVPPPPASKNNKQKGPVTQEAGAQTTGSTTSDATLAQGEEAPEDTENTEHDISAAGESLAENAATTGPTGDVSQEMMEVEAASRMDTDDVQTGVQPSQQSQGVDSDSSGGEDSDSSGGEKREEGRGCESVVEQAEEDELDSDDMEEDGGASEDEDDGIEEEDDEEEEDDDDDDDDDDDEDGDEDENEDEEGGSGYEDIFESDDGLFRVPGLDRESHDDIFMIQYSEPDASMPLVLGDNNLSFQLPYGLFEDSLGENSGVSSHPVQHPLMGFRTNSLDVGNMPPTRAQRANRQRRYQYLQLNARNPNPPVILQRLLGPGVHDLPLSTSQALASTFRDTRVVVMDSGLGLFNSEEDNGDGEQPGYLFGPSLAATLNNIPNALHWWNEEGKLLDGDSMPACVIATCAELVDRLEEQRDKELAEKKEKKKKQAEEEEEAEKKKKLEQGKTSESNMEIGSTESAAQESSRHQTALQMAASEVNNIVSSVLRATAASTPANTTTPADSAAQNSDISECGSSSSQPAEGVATDQQVFSETSEDSLPAPVVAERPSETESGVSLNTLVDVCTVASSATTSTPMETLSIPNSPTSSNAAENLEQDPLIASAPNPAEEASGRSGNSSEQLSRNVFEELDLDAAESWFRSQMEVQPRLSPTHSDESSNVDHSTPARGESASVDVEQSPAAPAAQQPTETTSSSSGAAEIPEGVDPSFLAALPEEMRQEVIAEQLRLQRLQQRARNAHTSSNNESSAASVLEVNPEFLAALPPNIQEEVLTQQRLEQQRQAAAAANPNDPVDAAAFFQNLAPTLRQAILTDMEESQISVLPPELAAEAQSLRRDWEARNRQIMQERFFSHVGHGSSALSSILRNPGRMPGRYAIHSVPQRQWGQWGRQAEASQYTQCNKHKGKPVLDHEALACLLVLLFVDEPNLNITRLQRVLRNLCYHGPTRDWITKALTCILEKCNECHSPDISSLVTHQGGRILIDQCPRTHSLSIRQAPQTETTSKCEVKPPQPSWLNITMDAALGSRANVFYVQRPSGKRSGVPTQSSSSIIIHPQATSTVVKHALDTYVSLAKVFPTFYFPSRLGQETWPLKDKTKPKHNKQQECDFWEVLLKLDSTSATKKGKSATKIQASCVSESETCSTSDISRHFQQIVAMLGFPVIRRSTQLTDKMLRLANAMAQGITETPNCNTVVVKSILLEGTLEQEETNFDALIQPNLGTTHSLFGISAVRKNHVTDWFDLEIPVNLLKLTIDVLTSKSCSEEGLEDATAFLLNMTSGPVGIRNVILALLLDGAKQLGAVVCHHIAVLMDELKELTKLKISAAEAEEDDGMHTERTQKGKLQDRFTNATVIVNAPSKVKGGCELQLPSMAALTSKTSSQAFFLRVLKVIMQLKDAMKANVKRGLFKKEDITLPPGVSFGDDAQPATEAGESASAAPTVTADQTASAAPEAAAPQVAVTSSEQEEEKPAPVPKPDTSETKKQESMDTGSSSKPVELSLVPCLSEQLNVDRLWDTLSLCLLELEHTPDHYAVLVLQPAVEAFFLVHSSSIEKESSRESREETRTDTTRRSYSAAASNNDQELAPVSPLPREEDPREEDSSSSSSSSSDPSVQASGTTGAAEPASNSLQNVSLEANQTPVLSPDTIKFLKFAEMHRTVLNQILRQSTVHLADGPFHVLVDHTRMLDFDVKRRYFRIELDRLDEGIRREELAVHVRRSHVFEDSFRELHRRSADEWKNRFYIVFEGEEGQDAGGLLREWYVIISREIFNPMYALFTTSPGDRVTYMINSTSHCNPNHLSYFKFVGRVIAKAIYDNKLLECYFTRSFYKHILGILVKYTDMESEDYSFYKGLVYLMENHVSEIGYDLAFSTEVQEFGVTETRDLIPNGRNIAVTEASKMEYVRLVCQMKMTGAIRKQLNAFLEGFYDIIPKRLISIFNEQELELLISGLPNVDIEDLKANTEYHKYQSTSLQIQWFWRALRSLDQADRAKFLQFVTGTSKVPLQGFGALEGMNGVQKFQIHRDDRSTDRLPSAHTCFNQLDLPVYETYDKLRSYLLKAIHECSEGFGFA